MIASKDFQAEDWDGRRVNRAGRIGWVLVRAVDWLAEAAERGRRFFYRCYKRQMLYRSLERLELFVEVAAPASVVKRETAILRRRIEATIGKSRKGQSTKKRPKVASGKEGTRGDGSH